MKNQTKNWKTRKQSGFTLLELLVVIAVIGILASLAVPRFQNQLKKAKFVEVINATGPYKTAVEICVQRGNALATCIAGNNGVPAASAASTSTVVASVNVAGNGVITATGGALVDGDTYRLTPALPAAAVGVNASGLAWAIGGTCLASGLCDPR